VDIAVTEVKCVRPKQSFRHMDIGQSVHGQAFWSFTYVAQLIWACIMFLCTGTYCYARHLTVCRHLDRANWYDPGAM